jgi:hypothetical protein
MKDNYDTSPSLLESRYRADRGQETLNIELGLVTKQTVKENESASASASNTVTGGGSVIAGASSGSSGGGTLCFAGHTPVTLPDGSRITFKYLFNHFPRIRYIKCFDERNRETKGEITHVYESVAYEYLKVTFSDGTIDEVKPEHRYFTVKGEYEPIRDLKGRFVATESGEPVQVMDFETVHAPDGVKFYNMTVSEFHNYCANGKRVSNLKPADGGLN